MKKGRTAAAKQSGNFAQQKLTIGLDLGDRNSWYCLLDEFGNVQLEQRVRTTDRAVGEPAITRVGARSDRGACPQRTPDWGEPAQGRPPGRAGTGAVGPDGSAVAVSSEASQRPSAGGSKPDPGTSWAGASAHR